MSRHAKFWTAVSPFLWNYDDACKLLCNHYVLIVVVVVVVVVVVIDVDVVVVSLLLFYCLSTSISTSQETQVGGEGRRCSASATCI